MIDREIERLERNFSGIVSMKEKPAALFVIDSKKEGKNKVFFLKKNLITTNYILQTEVHKLTRTLQQYPELSIIFEEILRKVDKRLIILFGSYAKGQANKKSDIDIYIETKNRNIKTSKSEPIGKMEQAAAP